jgi:hypothetical protein
VARVILEIERILGAYLEPISAHDAKAAVEQILLVMDRNDAAGAVSACWLGTQGQRWLN